MKLTTWIDDKSGGIEVNAYGNWHEIICLSGQEIKTIISSSEESVVGEIKLVTCDWVLVKMWRYWTIKVFKY